MAEDCTSMLAELMDDDSDRLTGWEVDFIESVRRREAPFTAAQAAQIWHRVYG
jgi:hypothetical protein